MAADNPTVCVTILNHVYIHSVSSCATVLVGSAVLVMSHSWYFNGFLHWLEIQLNFAQKVNASAYTCDSVILIPSKPASSPVLTH